MKSSLQAKPWVAASGRVVGQKQEQGQDYAALVSIDLPKNAHIATLPFHPLFPEQKKQAHGAIQILLARMILVMPVC